MINDFIIGLLQTKSFVVKYYIYTAIASLLSLCLLVSLPFILYNTYSRSTKDSNNRILYRENVKT